MAASRSFLAIDLGAESGRAILGMLRDAHLELSEIHRFSNRPARLPDGLHWDALQLWSEIKTAIGLGAHERHDLAGIGIDTWGVDFALLDPLGGLINNPYHYRDDRTEGMLAEAFARIPRERLFRTTGNQFMPINTLYQLLAMVLNKSPQLDMAQTLLMMPDLFNYWLTRRIASEFTIATTGLGALWRSWASRPVFFIKSSNLARCSRNWLQKWPRNFAFRPCRLSRPHPTTRALLLPLYLQRPRTLPGSAREHGRLWGRTCRKQCSARKP